MLRPYPRWPPCPPCQPDHSRQVNGAKHIESPARGLARALGVRLVRCDGWWSPKAVALDGKGNLVIKNVHGRRQATTDGCITTQGKFEHSFGYYVARIQLSEPARPLVGILDHRSR